MSTPPDSTPPPVEREDVDRPASAAPTEAVIEYGARERHDPYAALRYRDCRRYLVGWVFAIVGSQVQSVAVGWELFQRTGSYLALGWVGLVQAAPVILLALPAGHLADAWDRRRIVVASQAGAAVCSVGLAVLSWYQGPVGWMYVILGLGATFQAIGGPARSALLPATLPTRQFANAMMWSSSGFQVASVVGPAVGGLVLIHSVAAAYLVDAACAAWFSAFVATLTLRPAERKREAATWRTLLAGIRFVRDSRIILATITLDLFAVLLGGAVYLLPVFAEERLHVGSLGFGFLRAAPAVGALAMAMILAHRPPMARAGASLLWAVAGFGAATIVFGLSRNYWLSLAMLALTGAFDNVSVVVRHTLVQVMTPDTMRGRVSAVNNVFIGASNELGGWESGMTAWLFSPVLSVVGGGVGTLVVVAAVALAWPEVRRFGSLQDAKPIDEPRPAPAA